MDISFKLTPRILKNTQRLVHLYNTNLNFREQFDVLLGRPNVTFQGQPLVAYAWVIYKISPHYYSQAKEVWESQEKIKDLLVKYYHDRKELGNLDTKINDLGKTGELSQEKPSTLNEGILATAALIENTPEGDPKKVQLIGQIREEIKEDLKTPPTEEIRMPQPEPEHKSSESTELEATTSQPTIVERPTQLTSISEPENQLFIPEKPAPETLPIKEPASETAKEPKIIPAATQDQAPVPVIPENHAPIVLPKTENKLKEVVKKQAKIKIITPTPGSIKLAPEQLNAEPIKDIGITEENGIPQWTSPKTGKKYPLKIAGGSEVAVPPQRPQTPATPLPKVELPKPKEDLRQKISAFKKIQVPQPVQNIAKDALSFGKRVIIRNTPTVISATIGGFTGGALAGPTGIIPGFIGGGLFPKLIKGGILQGGATASVAKGAGKLALKGALGLSNPVGWAWLALSAPGVKTAVKYAVIAFLAIFALPIFMNLNKSQSLFPPYNTAYSAPLPVGGPGGGIPVDQSCKFTRDDQTPKDTSFNSALLLGYFQEASQISGVPAVLLAAIARVESPGSVNLTNSDIAGYADNRCAVSGTGALGIMQIQPPNTTGYFSQGVEFAAQQYLNTTPDKLTRTDFCNPRTNIILSAGFIIKKTYAMLGSSGSQWSSNWLSDKSVIDKIAEGYYGCLQYGAGTNKCEGPYNYGNDLWKSIQSCKAPSPQPAPPTNYVASCPVPGGKITTHSYDFDNKSGHCTPGSYEFDCSGTCPTWGRRAKAIDIDTGGPNGKGVQLPSVEGKSVSWKLLQSLCAGSGIYPTCSNYNGGTGALYTFIGSTTGSSDTWSLQLVHMQVGTALKVNSIYSSGTLVGRTDIDHVHATIGKNIPEGELKSSGQPITDCNVGWLASDSMCQ
ncbi:hypothetical protein A3A14_02965 [Candidatus Daviesbacteria bacterium RIFCSPLOWO2_01_FULL_43_38]|uniref:Transglycosylase SLT domain-containing protein n=1 Tax=Candidatus Daviesbacteria bacterium RIFCSPHIGHO2_12_FULL_43_11 TaxID=1797780 RepID=A0A1F5K360_9BACT|nr:MAG: hypothetical protein A2874_03550 [Candidatus Daviesbacteria bacterium RIFCSPHIGHO2_01_FULL_43_17]OGE35245.1 MAG: hypothetical protein A3E45_03685 [Candidatus Daviesbacteria bacterium RIFCSPHIGHO2_12_FULL_43_11]OGE63590.1 MAG: hypothetical protein A3A14_02965 [Candidatus Daviesbacteria bacterium RIFCSPLOWO2_01_FULL_43_38]OGE69209.1 MAG: hypothetical protein A3J21_01650 [Candidatus Daviesbacteria bacterium RIFCSPLOWO2_02_FULL_43_11]